MRMSHVTYMNESYHTHVQCWTMTATPTLRFLSATRRKRIGKGPNCNICAQGATHCNTLQTLATHGNTRQHTATHGNTRQHTATHRNTPQHTATHCNTLQHTATKSDIFKSRTFSKSARGCMCSLQMTLELIVLSFFQG